MTTAELETILIVLTSYSKLENNWDGEGGVIPSQTDISNAKRFLKLIKNYKAPIPMISGNGEVGFFWPEKLFGVYVDLGFLNGGFSYYAIDKYRKKHFKDENVFFENAFSNLMNMLR